MFWRGRFAEIREHSHEVRMRTILANKDEAERLRFGEDVLPESESIRARADANHSGK